MPKRDLDYYRQREAQERDRAEAATDKAVAAPHRKMATKYAKRILAIEQALKLDSAV